MGFPTIAKNYNDRIGSALIFKSAMNGTSVEFLAFLNSFSQNFSSDWNTQNVYGRNDPIATFRASQRTITISWDVPAGKLEEAKTNLENFSKLTQMIYPQYSRNATSATIDKKTEYIGGNALTLSKSPLIRLKFANLISNSSDGKGSEGLLGYITSLSWNPALDMGMFTDGSKLYPKVVNLNVSYSVLHEHDLGTVPPTGSVPGGSFPIAKTFPFGG